MNGARSGVKEDVEAPFEARFEAGADVSKNHQDRGCFVEVL